MHIDPTSLSPNIAGLLSATTNGAISAGPRGKSGKTRAPDSIAFSARGQGLGRLGAMLGRLSAAVRKIDASPDGLRAARSDIAGIEASIQKTLEGRGGPGQGFETQWVSGAVKSYTISQLDLAPGEEQEIDVRVTQSAQQGGMYLSLGGSVLDLGGQAEVTSSFTIEVSGAYGSRRLTFASGQTITQIAAAINSFSEEIGVHATDSASGTTGGITLRSDGYGAAEFVSVQVMDSGSIGAAENVGIYHMQADDGNTIDPSSHFDFNSVTAINGYTRVGQDVRGFINNVYASGYGTRLYAAMPAFAVSIDLATGDLAPNEEGNAQHLGRFLAMRFAGVERDQDHAGGHHDQPGWPDPR
jgi:hypothetical protein